jgi:hypothetical protein
MIIIVITTLLILLLLLDVPRYCRLKSCANLSSFDQNYQMQKIAESSRVVISMSTTPDRIDLMQPTIASLLDQSKKVHEIAVNVPHVSRRGRPYVIPQWLSELKSVKVYRVDEDPGPATKLLPTLQREAPDTCIIVVDDDVIYHSRTVESLLVKYHQLRKTGIKAAVTNYGVTLSKNLQLPTTTQRVLGFMCASRRVQLLQGFSGFLVTPSMFPDDVYDLKAGIPEAISVDDIWLSGWLAKNGVQVWTTRPTFLQLPLVNLGEMRSTVALGKGENVAFERDLKVIQWFRDRHQAW